MMASAISRVIATRVPLDIDEAIQERAAAQGVSVSEWVRALLIRSVRQPRKGTQNK